MRSDKRSLIHSAERPWTSDHALTARKLTEFPAGRDPPPLTSFGISIADRMTRCGPPGCR
jgi:hypothetical protein